MSFNGVSGMKSTWNEGTRTLSFTGEESMVTVDRWFAQVLYNGDIAPHAKELYYSLVRLHRSGEFTGYDFLFEGMDVDGMAWIRKAMRDYRTLHANAPGAYPYEGVKVCFDRVRAWRKQKKQMSKAKASNVSKMNLE